MTSSMTSTEQERELVEDLTEALESQRQWATRAAGIEATVAEMREVARQLRGEITALGDPFTAIQGLHTPATWTGNAATQSRQRLDTHEERFRDAVRSVETLATSLSDDAAELGRDASGARAQESARRSNARAIENQLADLRRNG